MAVRVDPLRIKITNPSKSDGGRASKPSVRDLYKALSLTSQFKVSLHLGLNNTGLERHLTRCGIFDKFRATEESYDFFAADAVLPGANFDMTEQPGAYQGMLEYNATRRIWPDFEVTYYVDSDYNILRLFEEWMNYINPLYGDYGYYDGGRHGNNGFTGTQSYYKMRYPSKYKKGITITKFEKNFYRNPNDKNSKRNKQSKIQYQLIDAFPKQLTAVPVSYDGSTITRVTVVFAYTRYITIKDNGDGAFTSGRAISRGRYNWRERPSNALGRTVSRELTSNAAGPNQTTNWNNNGQTFLDYDGTGIDNINLDQNFWQGGPGTGWMDAPDDWELQGDYSNLDFDTDWGIEYSWGQPSQTQQQVNLDNSRYGNTFPAGSFGITSNQSNVTNGLRGFDTEVQYDGYGQFMP